MSIPRALPEFHACDYGTVLKFQVRDTKNSVVDLSEICGASIIFMRPDGSNFSRVAQLVPAEESGQPDGIDGEVFYVLQPGDLTEPGDWYMQVHIAFMDGAWSSSVVQFVVFPNLFDPTEDLIP